MVVAPIDFVRKRLKNIKLTSSSLDSFEELHQSYFFVYKSSNYYSFGCVYLAWNEIQRKFRGLRKSDGIKKYFMPEN